MSDVITTGYEAERNRELIKVHKESSGVGVVDLAAVNISFSHRGMLKVKNNPTVHSLVRAADNPLHSLAKMGSRMTHSSKV